MTLPTRRVFSHKDVLRAMEEGRKALGLTMEDVSHISGTPDRYYNKVAMGLESDLVRETRRQLRGRPKPKGQPVVRYPMRMETSMAWMAEACGYALVMIPIEEAAQIIEPDPVTHLTYPKLVVNN